MSENTPETVGAGVGRPIVAKAGSYYRNARYVIVLMFVGAGGWFAWDGFHAWPAEIARAVAEKQNPPHTHSDVWLNKALGIALPPAGLLLLAWTLFNSRGAYRLEGETVSVPGHPPVPLSAIRRIDKRKWERKGIAYVEYELAEGGTGRFRLDDFVYQRDPTDQIFDRIEGYALERRGES